MNAQSSARGLQLLLLVGAVAWARPAFAEEAPEASEPSAEEEGEKRAKESVPSAKLAIHGISEGLHVRVLSRDQEPAMQGDGVAYCTQDCELKLPEGPYRLVTSQGDHQTTKDVDLEAPLSLTVSEP